MTEPVIVVPSAKRLINSLRDLGYDFSAAVADIIDNSIAADATRVDVDLEFEGDDSWIRVADNGKGMTPQVLREAMRYGADGDYDERSLGKFGLGLKTASMSQCRRLSVASRWNPDRADIAAYCWDLEHIADTDRWEILPLERDLLGPNVRAPLKDQVGTVVLWQRLDRILGFQHPYGESARKRMAQMCRDLEQHLGMVFHRFLTGEAVRTKKLHITINNVRVAPWDPFCRGEAATKQIESIRLAYDEEGSSGWIVIDPFILPHSEDYSTPEAFRRAAGPNGWNQQQGFYIYRGDRLIQSGGWSRLRKADEHTKLARIGISFLPVLDEAFKINVAKMRVHLPTTKRDEIRKIVAVVTKTARAIYDRKASSTVTTHPGRRTVAASAALSPTSPRMSGSTVSEFGQRLGQTSRYTLAEFTQWMFLVATEEERPILLAVIERLKEPTRDLEEK